MSNERTTSFHLTLAALLVSMPSFALRPSALALLLLPLAAGCDSLGDATFVSQVAVESYQYVDAPLAPVYLTRTVDATKPYVVADAAVKDAVVTMTLVGAGGAPDQVFAYRLADAAKGRYEPLNASATVQPLRTYRLSAAVPGQSAPVTAETITPGRFRILSTTSLDVPYAPDLSQPDKPVATFTVSRPQFSGKSATFVFTSETLLAAPTLDDTVPFLRAVLDRNRNNTPDFQEPREEDEAAAPTFEDFRLGSSPVVNEANYSTNADGTLTISLPWITVLFYGPLRVGTSALDDNLYDYLRSQAVQQGGTGISPGEVPNILSRVRNGTGIFGSLSRVTADLNVRKPGA